MLFIVDLVYLIKIRLLIVVVKILLINPIIQN